MIVIMIVTDEFLIKNKINDVNKMFISHILTQKYINLCSKYINLYHFYHQ